MMTKQTTPVNSISWPSPFNALTTHQEYDDEADDAGDGVDVGVDEGEEAGPAALEVVGGVVRPPVHKPARLHKTVSQILQHHSQNKISRIFHISKALWRDQVQRVVHPF